MHLRLHLWSISALLCLHAHAQTTTIRVPVRLVTVPTLVLSPDGHVVINLRRNDFRVFDNDRPCTFTVDYNIRPVSVAVAVQANRDVRGYLPFIAKVGSTLEALLVGATGESAAIFYGDEITVAKSFPDGDLSAALRALKPDGRHARAIDAGMSAIDLLRQRPPSRDRVLLYIGQPADHGSATRLDELRRQAERESISIYTLALPEAGKEFVSDTFALRGLSSAKDRGGFRVDTNLLQLIPVLARSAAAADRADPFSASTAATGGTQLHFRNQSQLEDAIAIVGVELRSSYTLSFRPDAEPGYHTVRVEVAVPGARTHARPGYWNTID